MSSIVDSETDPRELLEGLRTGDEASYEALVRQYGGRMLSVAVRIVRDPEEAKDCVQESFLQAFKNIDRFQERSSLGTWLHRIVVNSALQKLRLRRRRPTDSLDALLPEFDENQCRIEPKIQQQATVETLLDNRDTREAVRGAILNLPDDYREVVVLRDIEELDTQETADALQISIGAVKTRLHRARAALKKLLELDLREQSP